jgi:3-hydroxyacyl-[acyl-carrier-protein] dehydratase
MTRVRSVRDARGPCGFVLLDRLLELRPGQDVVATVCWADSNPIFDDHFPGRPLVPGVLLTEAMGQAAGWLIAATLGFARWPLLVMIDGAKFRRIVRPGDPVIIRARLRSSGRDSFRATADMLVGDARVANATLTFHAVTFSSDGPDDRRHLDWARATFTTLGGTTLLGAGVGGDAC